MLPAHTSRQGVVHAQKRHRLARRTRTLASPRLWAWASQPRAVPVPRRARRRAGKARPQFQLRSQSCHVLLDPFLLFAVTSLAGHPSLPPHPACLFLALPLRLSFHAVFLSPPACPPRIHRSSFHRPLHPHPLFLAAPLFPSHPPVSHPPPIPPPSGPATHRRQRGRRPPP